MDLIDEGMCFVCGKLNPIGLKVEFDVDTDNLKILGTFEPRREHEGYQGIMHGGLVATLLDEAMVKLVWEAGIPAVSASLDIKLLKPVRVGERIAIRGQIDSLEGRLILASAEIEDSKGTLLARAKGKCVRIASKED